MNTWMISTQKVDAMKKEPKGNHRHENYNNLNGINSRLKIAEEPVDFKLNQ